MRRICFLLFVILTISCGGDKEELFDAVIDGNNNEPTTSINPNPNDNDENDNSEQNTAPEIATLVFPLNETECSNSGLTFQWNESNDADGDNIIYTLIIDTSPNFNQDPKTYTDISETSYALDLPLSTALYWKIESSDSKETVSSETWSLYTQGEGIANSAPQIEYISPENDNTYSGDSDIGFEWKGTDTETPEEQLLYKLFFSEIGQNLELQYEGNETIFTLNSPQRNSEYQWVVYVTDGNGATNIGNVHTFTVN